MSPKGSMATTCPYTSKVLRSMTQDPELPVGTPRKLAMREFREICYEKSLRLLLFTVRVKTFTKDFPDASRATAGIAESVPD